MRLLQLFAIATLTVLLGSCSGAECFPDPDQAKQNAPCDSANNEICIFDEDGKGECTQDDNGRRCSGDTECADGEVCINTYCKNRPGEFCIRHSECSSGLCSQGRCTE